jgi:hypothetical protein
MTVLTNKIRVVPGSQLSCLYPKHGRRNILTRQTGEVTRYGNGDGGQFGPYVTIRREDGTHRTLSLVKMVQPVVG